MIRSDPEDEARPGAQARMLAWLLRLVGLLPLRWTHALGAVLGQAVYPLDFTSLPMGRGLAG